MANVNNIIVGAAQTWISKKDSTQVAVWPTYAIPTFVAAQTAVTPMNAATGADGWRNVGFTSEGIEVMYSPDYGDIQVDQLLDTAKLFKQAQTVSINTTLTEATLENLIFSFAQEAATANIATGAAADTQYAKGTGGESLGIAAGALGGEPVERALVFVGNAPRSTAGVKRERVYHARRVLNVEASSHSYRRNEATVFPVSFRLLPDPAFSGAEYGMIVDRNIAGA